MSEFNIVLAGVGGQGILLAAEIIGAAALIDGLNVRVSEIHGMAQRGGAVVSDVRIGEKVSAPTVMEGQADVLVGFEPIETLRSLKYSSEKTIIVMGKEKIPPTELAAKNVEYFSMEEILSRIRVFSKRIVIVDAVKLAKQAGNRMAQNIVMIGALAAAAPLPVKVCSLTKAIEELVPPIYVNVNQKAFMLGYESVKKPSKV